MTTDQTGLSAPPIDVETVPLVDVYEFAVRHSPQDEADGLGIAIFVDHVQVTAVRREDFDVAINAVMGTVERIGLLALRDRHGETVRA